MLHTESVKIWSGFMSNVTGLPCGKQAREMDEVIGEVRKLVFL